MLRINWTAAALGAAVFLLILPLWLANTPAMPDYPARLAGFYLIGGGHSSFYTVQWSAIPNLAAELIVPALARAMPLDVAARLFLSVAVAMWVAGPALIQRALYGRIGPMALVAAVFAYNINFMWGFFNYYFAVGLCLIAFAGWIGSAGWQRSLRLLLFAPVVIVLYFGHVLAAALFLLLVACYEVTRKPLLWRTLFVELAVLALPVGVLFLLQMQSAGGTIEFTVVGTFLRRLTSIVQTRFQAPAYVAIATLIILFAVGVWRGVISVHRRMRLALVVLWLSAFLVPEVAMGGWGLHLRFPAVAAAMLFASSQMLLPRRMTTALGVAVLASLDLLSFGLAQDWRGHDRQVAEFRAVLHQTPHGIRLMTAVDSDHMEGVPNALYWHLAEFALIDRDDATSLMFATNGQHIIKAAPAIAAISARTAHEGSPPDMEYLDLLAKGDTRQSKIHRDLQYLLRFPCHYDELLLIHVSGKPAHVPRMLKARHEGSFFTLYDVTRPAECSTISATRP